MTDWCSWWPDRLPLIGEWSYCCYEHDMAVLTDMGLAECVATAVGGGAALTAMGGVMYAGLKMFGWVYRATRQKKDRDIA